jgi:hypothetical protein
MTEVHHIQVPLWYLPLLVLTPAAVTAVAGPGQFSGHDLCPQF